MTRTDVTSVYRNTQAEENVRNWCLNQIAAWGVPHTRTETATSAGRTSAVTTGPQKEDRGPAVLLLPGTNMSTAQCLATVETLSREHRVTVVDLPGQPGLSSGLRPHTRHLAWYGAWLNEFLAQTRHGPVVVVGHSLGGAVALASDSPRIIGRVLLSSAGITRLRVPAPLLAATVPWLLRPTFARSAALVRRMAAPGHGKVAESLGEWMDLVGRCCRTSFAPPALPSGLLELRRSVPTLVVTGRFDPFLPPCHLGAAARRRLGAEFRVIEGAGHLLLDEAPEAVRAAVREFCAARTAG
ncbi:alpha/beta fold hydrolase [Streptomyces anulatus]